MWKYSIYPRGHIATSTRLPWRIGDEVSIAIDSTAVFTGHVYMINHNANVIIDHEYHLVGMNRTCVVQAIGNSILTVQIKEKF